MKRNHQMVVFFPEWGPFWRQPPNTLSFLGAVSRLSIPSAVVDPGGGAKKEIFVDDNSPQKKNYSKNLDSPPPFKISGSATAPLDADLAIRQNIFWIQNQMNIIESLSVNWQLLTTDVLSEKKLRLSKKFFEN